LGYAWGGGGGGGNRASTAGYCQGGAGGAAGFFQAILKLGDEVEIEVGGGGAGSPGNAPGSDGGDTVIVLPNGRQMIAPGGKGGLINTDVRPAAVVATGFDLNRTGGQGAIRNDVAGIIVPPTAGEFGGAEGGTGAPYPGGGGAAGFSDHDATLTGGDGGICNVAAPAAPGGGGFGTFAANPAAAGAGGRVILASIPFL